MSGTKKTITLVDLPYERTECEAVNNDATVIKLQELEAINRRQRSKRKKRITTDGTYIHFTSNNEYVSIIKTLQKRIKDLDTDLKEYGDIDKLVKYESKMLLLTCCKTLFDKLKEKILEADPSLKKQQCSVFKMSVVQTNLDRVIGTGSSEFIYQIIEERNEEFHSIDRIDESFLSTTSKGIYALITNADEWENFISCIGTQVKRTLVVHDSISDKL